MNPIKRDFTIGVLYDNEFDNDVDLDFVFVVAVVIAYSFARKYS